MYGGSSRLWASRSVRAQSLGEEFTDRVVVLLWYGAGGGTQSCADAVAEPLLVRADWDVVDVLGRGLEVLAGLVDPAQVPVGSGHVAVQGGVEAADTVVADLVGPVQALLVPVQGLLRGGLVPSEVVRGDAGVVVVLGRFPRLEEQIPCSGIASRGLGLHTLHAQLPGDVLGVGHGSPEVMTVQC